MEKKHFSHDHPLLEVECTAELCAGCRSDINGLAFGCKACSFYLHKLCANLPRDLSDPIRIGRFDRVELQFFPSGPGDDYFYCGECEHEGHEQGFAYVRYSCENFFLNGYGDENSDQVKKVDKLHVDCALLKQPYHKHSLAYINERKLFFAECAECGTKFQENEYEGSNLCGCEECGDAFHKKCLDLPEHVETEGTDPSKLNDFLDSVLWDYNDWDHYFCKGCNEEKVDPTNERLQHFSHRHPLVELECTSQLCAGCGSTIDGPSFGCERCPFSLHKHCANLPKELHHPSHPSGPLKLILFKYSDFLDYYPPTCEICQSPFEGEQQGEQTGFIYKCDGRCSSNEYIRLKVHAKCALLEPSLNSSYHKHPLTLIQEESFLAKCVACRTKFEFKYGYPSIYFCQECGDIFHKECINMPPQVKCDRHPHDLTLYSDPIPQNYEEKKYYCDDCNEERDIHTFAYACIECDFVRHTRCDLYEIAQEEKDEEEERECEVLMKREEEKLDKIEEKLKSLEEELRTTLSEKSSSQETLKDLKEQRDRIREKRGRNQVAYLHCASSTPALTKEDVIAVDIAELESRKHDQEGVVQTPFTYYRCWRPPPCINIKQANPRTASWRKVNP